MASRAHQDIPGREVLQEHQVPKVQKDLMAWMGNGAQTVPKVPYAMHCLLKETVVHQVCPASQVTKATKDSLGYLAVMEEMGAQASQVLQALLVILAEVEVDLVHLDHLGPKGIKASLGFLACQV